MTTFYAILGLIVVVGVTIGGVPYLIWVGRTAWRKRWGKVALQIVIPAVLLFLWGWVTLRAWTERQNAYVAGLFDAEAVLKSPVFEYNPKRDPGGGGGFTFGVYALPEAVRRRFESADARLRSEFPKRQGYREDWEAGPWREGPIEEAGERYFSFAVETADPGVREEVKTLREALGRPGTYYAFFKKEREGRVAGVDFFVVDLRGGRLYLINHER